MLRPEDTTGSIAIPDHPILSTLEPVIQRAQHVKLHRNQITQVAQWMAYEDLTWPDFRTELNPQDDPSETMDFIFLTSAINFAFTDFEKYIAFSVTYQDTVFSDSEAMVACLKRAYDTGIPILDGNFLAHITQKELSEIFSGNIPIPMLDQRLEILQEVGKVLVKFYQGKFHHFVENHPMCLYANGNGLLERLVKEFPSFRDESMWRSKRVVFQKRAQLLWWQLHSRFRHTGFFELEDPGMMTVFSDYILPVALRLLGITSYSPELEQTIQEHKLIPSDSDEEIEIRAFTIWSCHLLKQALNKRRPEKLQIIDPVLDGRLWTHYHTTHWPHHLTVTTSY